jgi:hypothetical protein
MMQRKSLHELIADETAKDLDSITNETRNDVNELTNGVCAKQQQQQTRPSPVLRTDSQSSVFVVERTGDLLETKSLPKKSVNNNKSANNNNK